MRLLKPPDPDPDPRAEPFRDGVAALIRDGAPAGHLVSTLTTFWSPSRPLHRQWWVWFVIIWADGCREPPQEDYPPWSVVSEMDDGYLEVDAGDHSGRYDVTWLADREAHRVRRDLGVEAGQI